MNLDIAVTRRFLVARLQVGLPAQARNLQGDLDRMPKPQIRVRLPGRAQVLRVNLSHVTPS